MKRLQQTGKALGSALVLTLVATDKQQVDEVFKDLWQRITTFEKQFSRFLPDSELTHFNQSAGQTVNITPSFKRLLVAAQQMQQATDGLYNPFILPDLQRAGYVGSWPQPSSYQPALNYAKRTAETTNQQLIITNKTAQMPVDQAIDFGGIGKGYLLDELAATLDRQGIGDYWLSLGGDIICNGQDINGTAWVIGIEHAEEATKTAGQLSNQGQKQAVATSGVTKRRGQNWHHIIDPRTGQPAETDILTATVAAQSATEADVWAKCLVILGSQKAPAFLRDHKIDQAIIQSKSKAGLKIQRFGDES